MLVENDFDFCARRAAEEFVAANRAQSPEQRAHHRKLAQQYADMVRTMLLARRDGQLDLDVAEPSSIDPNDEVQAA